MTLTLKIILPQYTHAVRACSNLATVHLSIVRAIADCMASYSPLNDSGLQRYTGHGTGVVSIN